MNNYQNYSPKYGANPSIPVCYWCQREKEEIALLGQINEEDDIAPKYIFVDYEPCDTCKHVMEQGITLVGLQEEPIIENQMSITKINNKDMYPIQGYIVVTEKYINDNIEDEHIRQEVLEKRKLYVPKEQLETLINDINERIKNE